VSGVLFLLRRRRGTKTPLFLAAEKLARGTGNDAASKDGEELDQVAGNAEDEIGDRIVAVRETELLYGPDSLLALYGPLLVRICGRPDQFKVRVLKV